MFRTSFFLLFLFLNYLDQTLTEHTNDADLIYKKLNVESIRWTSNAPQCTLITEEKRVDCFPEATQTGSSNNEQVNIYKDHFNFIHNLLFNQKTNKII